MKNGWKRWSDKEDALLLGLISEGMTPLQMAEKIQGRTVSAVSNRIYQKTELLAAYRATAGDRKSVKIRRPDPVIEASEAEIKSVADDNRIWLAMVGGLTSAVCSFSTLLIVLLALLS
jgi:hypothetical protein